MMIMMLIAGLVKLHDDVCHVSLPTILSSLMTLSSLSQEVTSSHRQPSDLMV